MPRLQYVFMMLLAPLLLTGCSGESAEPVVEPESSAATPWRSGTTIDETWSIKWRALADPIPVGEPFAVEVIVEGDPDRLQEAVVFVDAEMPHHGHGMNFVPKIEGEPGHGTAQGLRVHMPGRWEFSVDVMDDGKMERAQWTVLVE